MLNFDVKRKINTLRDILVGKVPDPKAQVEQITIALIYKFMDDMDMDGVSFGGNREFFKGEYEKYAFSQLMQSENSAQQRLNLYAEGIEKMSLNPNLPQLFRDIFRGAYIPYRDPETLNMFLKEIAEFSYEDSEDLGNAFEYLLSIMGSQGDAGQFRTPRHIIDMMVAITAPQKNETVLDPACGTAGFLISAYKHIKNCNKDKDGNSTLAADDKNRMIANFAGYDISPDMVRLSRVNMYLHGFTKPQISEYDTLTSLDKWEDNYDIIFANPPFMTPKGGIIPHNRYHVSAKRAEVLFVDYIAEHLNPTGRAAVIVPEGIVFQSATAYKNLRKYLVDDGLLYAVISLPAGVFNPYSGVKTSILLMNKKLAKERDSILFVKLNNDGYDLGAQRREIKGSEISDVVNVLQDYRNGVDVTGRANVTLAKKTDIAGQDYILVGERYKVTVAIDTEWPMVKLGDVCLLNPPKSELHDISASEYVSFVPMADLGTHSKSFVPKEEKPIGEVYTGYTYFKNGDVLLAKVTPCFENGKAGVAQDLKNGIGFGSSEFYVLRPNPRQVLHDYVYRIISNESFIELGKQHMTGTGGLQRVTKDFVANYMIPLPPLSVQEEIVAEIDGYQKIIDGARQVVENYKPTIKIDPAWETVKLGDVCICITDGDHLPPPKSDTGIPFITISNISSNNRIDFSNTFYVPASYYDKIAESRKPKRGDVLYTVTGSFGIPVYIDFDKDFCFQRHIGLIRPNGDMLSEYLFYILQTTDLYSQAQKSATGMAQKTVSLTSIRQFNIPLPTIEKQREIVARIGEEMEIVNQNKRLIEIFQQKIKDKISEVWGQ